MTYTRIRNPGIAERLKKDISCFESYGFTLENSNSGNNSDDHCVIFHSIDDPMTPTASLYIQVSGIALLASIGPYLRTLVRLCVDPINPRSLQAIVAIDDKSDKKKKKKKNVDDDDDGSRSIAHAIHMLIRNSMGAALFLNLHIVLPPETRREKVLERMKQNENGCYEYPSVIVHEHDSNSSTTIKRNCRYTIMGSKEPFIIDLGLVQKSIDVPPSIKQPLSQDCLKSFDLIRNYLSLNITTRMCTIRLTPLLYHLSQRLIGNVARIALSKEEETLLSKTKQQQRQQQQYPMIIVCLEKISNLYRVLMLARDYGINIGTIGRQLVVVCKHNSTERFRIEAINFVSKNFTSLVVEDDDIIVNAATQRKKSSYPDEGKESSSSRISYSPLVVSIEEARELIVKEAGSSSFPNVVGFDLHKDAKTLSEHNSDANVLISSAGAIILGYESDGIPPRINQVVSQYVQIQSRTSINVVAAFSIVLHAIMVQ